MRNPLAKLARRDPAKPTPRQRLMATKAKARQVFAVNRALLKLVDGDTELEDGGDAEPSLGALEGRKSQIVWLRGTDRDLEVDHHQ